MSDKYFIVEHTMAYKIPAKDSDEAMEKYGELPGLREKWHEEAGFWSEVSAVYEVAESEGNEEFIPIGHKDGDTYGQEG
jgi:hypothetical protein